ncbi:putative radical SAM domain protein [Magnetofaba australis IT-1]|uniref:Putative radical SAM domain protein n=2 Tax=Magnetofaba TaxID=1472292 RepID=A0A1Y2K2C8_9PROT|nr:putative radical SAM domain protein [Magnetofaba australis IT-1]
MDAAIADWPDATRVFLADGDALTLPTDELLRILDYLQTHLPGLTRVSSYALPANLRKKSVTELERLSAARLTLLYYGIETGAPALLKRITKGATPDGMVDGLNKAAQAGMKVSATVVLGLGGANHWQEHIDGTVELLQRAPLSYLSTLQLYLEESVRDDFLAAFDPPFIAQDDIAILREQHRLIDALTDPPQRLIFRSNHASNALALAGNLPRDRDKLLAQIDAALSGDAPLRPAYLRGL